MKIYGNPLSGGTRLALMAAAEKKIPHELVVLDFAKSRGIRCSGRGSAGDRAAPARPEHHGPEGGLVHRAQAP